jgi:hypothetical protein
VIFVEKLKPISQHILRYLFVCIEVCYKLQPISFEVVGTFPMAVAQFPAVVTESWDPRVSNFDFFASDG